MKKLVFAVVAVSFLSAPLARADEANELALEIARYAACRIPAEIVARDSYRGVTAALKRERQQLTKDANALSRFKKSLNASDLAAIQLVATHHQATISDRLANKFARFEIANSSVTCPKGTKKQVRKTVKDRAAELRNVHTIPYLGDVAVCVTPQNEILTPTAATFRRAELGIYNGQPYALITNYKNPIQNQGRELSSAMQIQLSSGLVEHLETTYDVQKDDWLDDDSTRRGWTKNDPSIPTLDQHIAVEVERTCSKTPTVAANVAEDAPASVSDTEFVAEAVDANEIGHLISSDPKDISLRLPSGRFRPSLSSESIR